MVLPVEGEYVCADEPRAKSRPSEDEIEPLPVVPGVEEELSGGRIRQGGSKRVAIRHSERAVEHQVRVALPADQRV